MHSLAKRFRLYRIQFRWSLTGGAAPSADGQVPFVPDVSITPVKFGLSDEDLTSQEIHNVSRPPWQLSILELVSMPPHGASLDPASPLVLAVFSNMLEQQAAGFQDYRSAVVRWELHKLPSTPHPIFVQLGASAQKSHSHSQGSVFAFLPMSSCGNSSPLSLHLQHHQQSASFGLRIF